MTEFIFHSDPAHGWLQVDWTHLKAVGLNPQDFSTCSYRRGNTFFLEEDCDAPKFIRAYCIKNSVSIEGFNNLTAEVRASRDSFIRALPSIRE